NVRELINAMERAVLLCRGDKITLEDLPEALRPQVRPDGPAASAGGFVPPGSDWLDRPLREVREQAIARIERSYLEHQLERTHGRIGETAARAGITPRALHDKLKRCGLRKEDYKAKDRGR
ncbi:MAG: sigma-54-dependent Fis family transcriptional regulator, partial [Acidobacteriota bacterium]|nr:sigma-54-dependent Fis family transcriptional regulator [Acidobacteriota bacterium]